MSNRYGEREFMLTGRGEWDERNSATVHVSVFSAKNCSKPGNHSFAHKEGIVPGREYGAFESSISDLIKVVRSEFLYVLIVQGVRLSIMQETPKYRDHPEVKEITYEQESDYEVFPENFYQSIAKMEPTGAAGRVARMTCMYCDVYDYNPIFGTESINVNRNEDIRFLMKIRSMGVYKYIEYAKQLMLNSRKG